MLTKLTSGIVLQAQIAGYNHQNIPEIFLFASLGTNVCYIIIDILFNYFFLTVFSQNELVIDIRNIF